MGHESSHSFSCHGCLAADGVILLSVVSIVTHREVSSQTGRSGGKKQELVIVDQEHTLKGSHRLYIVHLFLLNVNLDCKMKFQLDSFFSRYGTKMHASWHHRVRGYDSISAEEVDPRFDWTTI